RAERQAPCPRIRAADQQPSEHAAVDRETTFPDGDDLRRHPCVVVEVEEHVVEARADQATEERELGRLQQRLGIEAATNRIAMREHEAERHRGRHQDAVPAQRERADVEGDGAGRTEHQERWTRDGTNGVGVAAVEFTVSLYGALVSLSNKTRTL